jgi:hypothetical protein
MHTGLTRLTTGVCCVGTHLLDVNAQNDGSMPTFHLRAPQLQEKLIQDVRSHIDQKVRRMRSRSSGRTAFRNSSRSSQARPFLHSETFSDHGD